MRNIKCNRLKRIAALILIVVMSLSTFPVYTYAAGNNVSTEAKAALSTASAQKPRLNYEKCNFYVGAKTKLKLLNASGQKVTWKSKNKKIASVNKKGKVTAKKKGTTYITATCGGKTYRCKVIVLSDSAFLKKWCKAWAKTYTTKDMSPYEKAIRASSYVTHTFKYGNTGSAVDVLKTGKGTCYSGGLLVAALLKNMGIKASVRYAMKDKKSRYPAGIIFYAQHYNVCVKIKGKKYYVDGTPGLLFCYMSSSKKPIYYSVPIFGTVLDLLPGHKKVQ